MAQQSVINAAQIGRRERNTRPKVGVGQSALTGLKAALRLIDNVDAAFAAHETIVAVAAAQ
jgi:hypothetical protein